MTTPHLDRMLNDIREHQHPKNDLLTSFVKERLSKSLETYQHELELSVDYLERRKDEINLIKKINKL